MTSPQRSNPASHSTAPSATALAGRLGHLLDEFYPRLAGPQTLYTLWLPMQMMIVRDRVGRCKQRWDKTLLVKSVVTSAVLAEPLSQDLPLAKSYGQLVFPNRATETCLDRLCQLVVLQALLTATGKPDIVTVQVLVNGQHINLTEAVDLPT